MPDTSVTSVAGTSYNVYNTSGTTAITTASDLAATATPTTSPYGITNQSTNYYSSVGTVASGNPTLGGSVSAGVAAGALAVVPPAFRASVNQIADFQLGTFLSTHGAVSGSTGSLINGVLSFVRAGNATTAANANVMNNQNFSISSSFIPITIVTEFNLAGTYTNSTSTPSQLFIIFQSTPDSILFSKTANWNPKDIYGRPEPIQIFASSSAVTFSLTGMFFADSPSTMMSNINLEKQLFALVTPSKNHFMPSPVQVKIGNWKALRCITTSVNIDFQGPWYIPTSSSVAATGGNILSHAPYVYTVTFNFTVTSQQNSVQYAEDIVDYGFNGGIQQTNSTSLHSFNTTFNPTSSSPNFFAAQSTASYNSTTGELTYSVVGTAGGIGSNMPGPGGFNTAAYLAALGLPTSANNSQSIAAMGSITSGLGAIVQTTINNNYGPRVSRALGS